MKRGFDRTSVRDLAKAFDISQGGLYHYIGSKNDILHGIVHFTMEACEKILEAMQSEVHIVSTAEKLKEAFKRWVEFVNEFDDYYNFINHVMVNLEKKERQIIFDVEKRLLGHFENLIRRGVDAGEFKTDDPQLVAFDIVNAVENWAYRRWFLRKRYTLEEYVRTQTQIILKALQAE